MVQGEERVVGQIGHGGRVGGDQGEGGPGAHGPGAEGDGTGLGGRGDRRTAGGDQGERRPDRDSVWTELSSVPWHAGTVEGERTAVNRTPERCAGREIRQLFSVLPLDVQLKAVLYLIDL